MILKALGSQEGLVPSGGRKKNIPEQIKGI
jgi:hypothetical protein